MPESDTQELYQAAIRSILRRIDDPCGVNTPEGVQALAIAVNTLESARIVAMSCAETSDFTTELMAAEDPGTLPN